SPGLAECNEICYKHPVLKDHQWSAYIDRSPGAADYSKECFRGCKAGCGYKVSCVLISKIFLLYLIFLYFTDAMCKSPKYYKLLLLGFVIIFPPFGLRPNFMMDLFGS
ncbi:hypothetical protein CFOL_v3_02370, partial [Cephalotus follicularis]